MSVFSDWIRRLEHGGHAAIVRVRPEGIGPQTLKIYTYPGTPEDDLLDRQRTETEDTHLGTYFHGMMTFDYFAIVRTVRNRDGTWKTVDDWTEVPFPMALVVFGTKEDPDPEE